MKPSWDSTTTAGRVAPCNQGSSKRSDSIRPAQCANSGKKAQASEGPLVGFQQVHSLQSTIAVLAEMGLQACHTPRSKPHTYCQSAAPSCTLLPTTARCRQCCRRQHTSTLCQDHVKALHLLEGPVVSCGHLLAACMHKHSPFTQYQLPSSGASAVQMCAFDNSRSAYSRTIFLMPGTTCMVAMPQTLTAECQTVLRSAPAIAQRHQQRGTGHGIKDAWKIDRSGH